MIISSEKMKQETKDSMRGGKGSIDILHLVEPPVLRNGRLFAKVTIPPGSSIGEHQHQDETEYYVFLEGEGLAIDNGEENPVKAGDVMITREGGTHSIKNNSTDPLVLMAVILND